MVAGVATPARMPASAESADVISAAAIARHRIRSSKRKPADHYDGGPDVLILKAFTTKHGPCLSETILRSTAG